MGGLRVILSFRDNTLKATLVVHPRGAREAGLVRRSRFEEFVRSVYLSTQRLAGFFRQPLDGTSLILR